MSTTALSRQRKKTGAKQNVTPSLVHWRFVVVLVVIMLVFSVLAARAAYIQVIEPDELIQQGDNRTLRTRDMPTYRGLITDRNGVELAVSVPVRAIYADPKVIHENNGFEEERRWEALADVLRQDVNELKEKVANPKRRFVYLQRQVSPAMAEYVDKLDIPGIYLRRESRRYYPTGEVSAQLIGVTDVDDTGVEGLERMYDEWLTGTPGSRKIRRDAKGAYKEIKEAMIYYQSSSASAIVIDVKSGDVLAMVNAPSFNPNDRSDISAHRMRNRVITDAFEPGSALKPLAVLTALEFGEVEPEDSVNTHPGWMRLGGSLVKDSRNYGELTLEEIIQHSSNMGTSKLALSVPKQFLLDTYYNMGLMSDTGLNMAGESSGIFHERSRWSEFELATLSFGYGISVTTAQLGRLYATLANGGIKTPLNIIKSPEQPSWQAQSERVISEENAKAIVQMMESVTQRGGTAIKASVPGYRVAGKTGTSRKAVAGGYGEEYVNIFAGIAPVSDPRLVTIVLINEPGGDLYHAGDTAAPVFSSIMGGALHMLNVTPDDKQVTSSRLLKGGQSGS